MSFFGHGPPKTRVAHLQLCNNVKLSVRQSLELVLCTYQFSIVIGTLVVVPFSFSCPLVNTWLLSVILWASTAGLEPITKLMKALLPLLEMCAAEATLTHTNSGHQLYLQNFYCPKKCVCNIHSSWQLLLFADLCLYKWLGAIHFSMTYV